MIEKNSNTRPRFGSDWDLDLGWVLVWFLFFATLVGIIAALAYASVQNNRGNVARDNFYAQHCKVISRAPMNNTSGNATYQCQ